jgi:uncharacterized protein YjbI with pentapeptide repeats
VVDASSRSGLAGADLSYANLSGVAFLGVPVDLSAIKLDNANLQGAMLDLADLSGATFHNVQAAGASFRGASLAPRGNLPGASFAGPQTDLTQAIFVDADVSGASFASANISGAVFSSVLAVGTDFNGVRAVSTSFTGAHIYGDGQSFDNATDLSNADFSGAVLAGVVDENGGFDMTKADLTGARFDGTQCIGCNFTDSKLDGASFAGAYLVGSVFSGATLNGTDLYNSWLYCGDTSNSACAGVPQSSPPRWVWPLALGFGEVYGPVPFANPDLTGVSLQGVKVCPNGTAPSGGCSGSQLLPDTGHPPPLPAACSATAFDACPATTKTMFDATRLGGVLSVTSLTPPTWASTVDRAGYAIGLSDSTIRHVGDGDAQILAGSPGRQCPESTGPCGDGGPASQALLGTPDALAIGLDGSLYIADSALHRVRRIDPSGNISTVAGSGQACGPVPAACGDGGPATSAQLGGPYGVWVDARGLLVIADGKRGLRSVGADGALSTLYGTDAYDIRGVVGDARGLLYAATNEPDYVIKVDPTLMQVSVVVGTGTSGYNGSGDADTGLLPGTQVQINKPGALSVDRDGRILFADTGNNLVRAYVPATGFVIDDLAGMVTNGAPQGGFNGDNKWADQTELSSPRAVTATSGAQLVVADTRNNRLRQFYPRPLDADNVAATAAKRATATPTPALLRGDRRP